MLVLIAGQDTYRARLKLEEIATAPLERFDGKTEIFSFLKEALRQESLFEEKKIYLIKNPFSFKDELEEFIEEIIVKRNLIVFWEEADVSKDQLFKKLVLDKRVKTFIFPALKPGELSSWMRGEFLRYQVKVAPNVINQLILYSGNDLWRLSQEIRKLSCYVGKEGSVSLKELELLVKPLTEIGIFEVIDAIASKNKVKAFSLIKKQLANGESAIYILAMINFQFRNLLMVKEAGTSAKDLGLHPFVVKKTASQAVAFSLIDLKRIYRKLFQVDAEVKQGKLDSETGLEFLVAEICSITNKRAVI